MPHSQATPSPRYWRRGSLLPRRWPISTLSTTRRRPHFLNHAVKLEGLKHSGEVQKRSRWRHLPHWIESYWLPVRSDKATDGPVFFGSTHGLLANLADIAAASPHGLGTIPDHFELMRANPKAFYPGARCLRRGDDAAVAVAGTLRGSHHIPRAERSHVERLGRHGRHLPSDRLGHAVPRSGACPCGTERRQKDRLAFTAWVRCPNYPERTSSWSQAGLHLPICGWHRDQVLPRQRLLHILTVWRPHNVSSSIGLSARQVGVGPRRSHMGSDLRRSVIRCKKLGPST